MREGSEDILDIHMYTVMLVLVRETYLSIKDFFLTTLRGLVFAAPISLFRCAFARAFWIGEAYGGGFLPLIASQSKGRDADIDGDKEGE